MHWRFWRRGQRAEILAALSLVLSERRPLIPGLEGLAASDLGLKHLLAPLLKALRHEGEIHLNQTLCNLGYLDADESRLLGLAMAQDKTHECLESLSWRQRVGGVNMALIRWFPVWIVLSMMVGFGILGAVRGEFFKIFKELGLKLPALTQFLMDAQHFYLACPIAAILIALWILWQERKTAGPGTASFWCSDLIPRHLLLQIVREARWNADLNPTNQLVQMSHQREQRAWNLWLRRSRWKLDPVLKTELSLTTDTTERFRRLGFFPRAHGPSPACWARVEEDLTQDLRRKLEYRQPIFLGLIMLVGFSGAALVIGYWLPLFSIIQKLGAG